METPSEPPNPPRPKITSLPDLEDDGGPLSSLDLDFAAMQPNQDIDLEKFLSDGDTPNRPLIDAIAPMSELRAEYANGSPTFIRQIDWLEEHGYKALRRAKGDGDCFYRSLAFAYVERAMKDHSPEIAVGKALSTLEATTKLLEDVEFHSIVYEDVYDTFIGLLRNIIYPDDTGTKLTPHGLLEEFQMPIVSNSIVCYLRLVTSAHMRLTAAEMSGLLFHPETGESMGVEEFCQHVIEPFGKEADHVQINALCRALQLDVDVAYLNGRGDIVDFVPIHNGPDEKLKAKPLKLLYRPGHFDILYGPDSV